MVPNYSDAKTSTRCILRNLLSHILICLIYFFAVIKNNSSYFKPLPLQKKKEKKEKIKLKSNKPVPCICNKTFISDKKNIVLSSSSFIELYFQHFMTYLYMYMYYVLKPFISTLYNNQQHIMYGLYASVKIVMCMKLCIDSILWDWNYWKISDTEYFKKQMICNYCLNSIFAL